MGDSTASRLDASSGSSSGEQRSRQTGPRRRDDVGVVAASFSAIAPPPLVRPTRCGACARRNRRMTSAVRTPSPGIESTESVVTRVEDDATFCAARRRRNPTTSLPPSSVHASHASASDTRKHTSAAFPGWAGVGAAAIGASRSGEQRRLVETATSPHPAPPSPTHLVLFTCKACTPSCSSRSRGSWRRIRTLRAV